MPQFERPKKGIYTYLVCYTAIDGDVQSFGHSTITTPQPLATSDDIEEVCKALAGGENVPVDSVSLTSLTMLSFLGDPDE